MYYSISTASNEPQLLSERPTFVAVIIVDTTMHVDVPIVPIRWEYDAFISCHRVTVDFCSSANSEVMREEYGGTLAVTIKE